MKVGVTGASGYVGKKVVKVLQNNNHEVFKFVRRSVKSENEIRNGYAKDATIKANVGSGLN